MRNRHAVPAVLAIPSVSIEEDEVVEDHAGLTFFPNPEQALNGGPGSALGPRIKLFDTKGRWSCRGAYDDAVLTLSTFDRGCFRQTRLGF
jgi:hypothetical protein